MRNHEYFLLQHSIWSDYFFHTVRGALGQNAPDEKPGIRSIHHFTLWWCIMVTSTKHNYKHSHGQKQNNTQHCECSQLVFGKQHIVHKPLIVQSTAHILIVPHRVCCNAAPKKWTSTAPSEFTRTHSHHCTPTSLYIHYCTTFSLQHEAL